jgi:hypothetical protein
VTADESLLFHRLSRAGHEVVFSYSRSEKKLERLAREAATKATLP